MLVNERDERTARAAGVSRRDWVRSMAALAVGGTATALVRPDPIFGREAPECRDAGRVAPESRAPLTLDVSPTELKHGDLLVTDQYNSRVYHVRSGQVRPLVAVHTWGRSHLWDTIASPDRRRLYISMSGLRGPQLDYVGVKGLGAILEIDVESGALLRTFSSLSPEGWPYHEEFIDVNGMTITADGRRLLVADFLGFAHRGKILQFDLAGDGAMSVFAEGLMEPAGMSPDGPDHVLVGNARMPGGAELGGEVVRLNVRTGAREVLFNVGLTTGAMIGVARLSDGQLVGSISDWPDQKRSVVIRIDGPTAYTPLLSPDLAFFSAQLAPDDAGGFWVAESVERILYRLDGRGRVLETIRIDACAEDYRGPVQPLVRAFDTLESVRMVA